MLHVHPLKISSGSNKNWTPLCSISEIRRFRWNYWQFQSMHSEFPANMQLLARKHQKGCSFNARVTRCWRDYNGSIIIISKVVLILLLRVPTCPILYISTTNSIHSHTGARYSTWQFGISAFLPSLHNVHVVDDYLSASSSSPIVPGGTAKQLLTRRSSLWWFRRLIDSSSVSATTILH